MLIESGDLIPVRLEAVDIPWTKRKTQILNCLHKGPVSFKTYVYDTNVGDIAPLSTYFNPKKWTEHDLNFKFGITTSETLLNINSAGNSSASSTSESLFGASSNFKKLQRDGSDGEHASLKNNSLQPRLMVIADEAITSVVSNISAENTEASTDSKQKGISSNFDAGIAKTTSSSSSLQHTLTNLYSKQEKKSSRSASLNLTANIEQVERTKRWVSSGFTEVKAEAMNRNMEGDLIEDDSKSLQKEKDSNHLDRATNFMALAGDYIPGKRNMYNLKNDAGENGRFSPLAPMIDGKFGCNEADNLFQNVPKVTFTNVKSEKHDLISNEMLKNSLSIPQHQENDTNNKKSSPVADSFGSLSPVDKYNSFVPAELSLIENIERESEEIQDSLQAVLQCYGIRKRSASIADLPNRRHGRIIEPIGPPKNQNTEVRNRICSDPYYNASFNGGPKKSECFNGKESPNLRGWVDDVFSNQNESTNSKIRKPFHSTSACENILKPKNNKSFDEGLQWQHEHWDNKLIDARTIPLQSDGCQIFSTTNMVPSVWKKVENNLGDKSPSFLSPWTTNSRIIPAFPINTSPATSVEQDETILEPQHLNNSVIKAPTIRKTSSIKSPYVSLESSPASEGNSIGTTSSNGINKQPSLKMENTKHDVTRIENQSQQGYYLANDPQIHKEQLMCSDNSAHSIEYNLRGNESNLHPEQFETRLSDENQSAYLAFGQDLSTMFDDNRGSSFFELWTPGRFDEKRGGYRETYMAMTPDKFEDNGVEKALYASSSNPARMVQQSHDENFANNYEFVANNSFNTCDTEHLVRGLRKLAGENLSGEIYN